MAAPAVCATVHSCALVRGVGSLSSGAVVTSPERDVLLARSLAEETKATNLSLLSLGKVIHSLAEGQKHVPYRESMLTRLLQVREHLGYSERACTHTTHSTPLLQVREHARTPRHAFASSYPTFVPNLAPPPT